MTQLHKILSVSAIAVSVIAQSATAQSSVRQFKDELDQKLGTKKNGAAAAVISRTIKKFVRRDATKVVAYARIGNLNLKKLVKDNLRGKTALTILKGTARGFLGVATLDSRFSRFVTLVIRKLPSSQKTAAVLKPISDRLIAINRSRGGSPSQDQDICDLVYGAGGQACPTMS